MKQAEVEKLVDDKISTSMERYFGIAQEYFDRRFEAVFEGQKQIKDSLERRVDGLEVKLDRLESKVDGLGRRVENLEKNYDYA